VRTFERSIGGRPTFLASVTDADEAMIAHRAGADLIDAKNPSAGALGALPLATISAIRRALPEDAILSATVGDLPCLPDVLTAAAKATLLAGADYVKVGIFPGGLPQDSIARLGALGSGRGRIVGLLLADRAPDFGLIAAMADAGFAGVMLDTADKSAGALPDVMDLGAIESFVREAHMRGIFSGLAGALRLAHIAPLVRLNPDVLGFRGALCANENRTGRIDAASLAAIRGAITANARRATTCPVATRSEA